MICLSTGRGRCVSDSFISHQLVDSRNALHSFAAHRFSTNSNFNFRGHYYIRSCTSCYCHHPSPQIVFALLASGADLDCRSACKVHYHNHMGLGTALVLVRFVCGGCKNFHAAFTYAVIHAERVGLMCNPPER